MCGVAGAIGHLDDSVIEAVRRISDAQQHRGPDATGCTRLAVRETSDLGVVLAHQRLSIIDLCEHANQPMRDDVTGNVLVYNGEVYNFRELRAELESQHNVSFKTSSDTEVVLQAYHAWGERCVERFRGMFAFALWDSAEQALVLARDRLGIKPLYVAGVGEGDRRTVLVASELRALLDSGLIDRRLDPGALETYLWHGFVVGRQTIISGIELLQAGTVARITADGRMSERQYWSLDQSSTGRQTDTSQLEQELRRAVELRLISDVPLGVFLSGGVDSTAVAALAATASNAPVRTFNIAFDEAEFDESTYARSVAEKLGTEHTEIRLSEQMFRDSLGCALSSIDQPTFDAINTYFVSSAVRNAGLTVALAGTGGDELFGGYKSFVDIPIAMKWSQRLGRIPPPLRSLLINAITRLKTGAPGVVPPQVRWGKLHDVADAQGDLLHLYQVSYALFTQSFLQELSSAEHAHCEFGLPGDLASQWRDLTDGISSLRAISRLELSSFIGQRLLRDTDAASMAVSLEVRVPLLDHHVVEAVDALDPRVRYAPLGRKDLLKRLAMPDLDPSLFDRPKAGFVLPIEQWARRALRDEMNETLTNGALCRAAGLSPEAVSRLWRAFQDGAAGLYWSRIWSVFVLLWWCREHRVSL